MIIVPTLNLAWRIIPKGEKYTGPVIAIASPTGYDHFQLVTQYRNTVENTTFWAALDIIETAIEPLPDLTEEKWDPIEAVAIPKKKTAKKKGKKT